MRCLLALGGILTPATPLRCEVVHRPSAANAQAAQASAGMRGPGGDPSTEGARGGKGALITRSFCGGIHYSLLTITHAA